MTGPADLFNDPVYDEDEDKILPVVTHVACALITSNQYSNVASIETAKEIAFCSVIYAREILAATRAAVRGQ